MTLVAYQPEHTTTSDSAATAAAWTLIRSTFIALPAFGPAARHYVVAADRAAHLAARQEALRGPLEDALYDLVPGADTGTRTRILLPLRRAIHNGRRPPAAAREGAAGLAMPALAQWVEVTEALHELTDELGRQRSASAGERRSALAAQAGTETVARAAATTSSELLAAVRRYAALGGRLDRRAAKSEPAVLRHVLRAATKTVPLTWFAGVGWDDRGIRPMSEHNTAPASRTLAGLARVSGLVGRVAATLPAGDRPLALAQGLHAEDLQLVVTRYGSHGPEVVRLPMTATLQAVLDAVGQAPIRSRRAATLTDVATALPSLPQEVLHDYLERLIDLGVLMVDPGLDPADIDGVTTWLAQVGADEEAMVLDQAAGLTGAYATTSAADRPRMEDDLTHLWGRLHQKSAAQPLLTEDARLGAVPTARSDRVALCAIAPLAETFDAFALLRRAQTLRFVAAYGRGGVCPSLGAYAANYDAIWTDPTTLDASVVSADPVFAAIHAARAAVADRVRHVATDGGIEDSVLALEDFAHVELPRASGRPTSLSWFVQPGTDIQVVNQIYGGWGRFASRFLDVLPARAMGDVREPIAAALGDAAIQVRPLANFAANVHPLVVGRELVESVRWRCPGDLRLDQIEVVHDPVADEVRFRARGRADYLDVLYHGFLVPIALPAHLRAVVNDLGSGLVDFSDLTRTVLCQKPIGPLAAGGRLQVNATVLSRRVWHLAAEQVAALQAALACPDRSRELLIAQMRATAGWPRHIFLGDAPSGRGEELALTAAFTLRMGARRSQYVDLADPLHVELLGKILSKYSAGARVEEALPIPVPGSPPVEEVVETYRPVGASEWGLRT